jgi:two-component system, sensor histidine kinase and response regulator
MTYREEDEVTYPAASLLVVDDREANLTAVEALLSPLGHRIVKARSGKEALQQAASEEFAVILMDVHMPMLDGFATVEGLRNQDPACDTPIVFMSAVYDDSAHMRRAYELGAVDYVSKPTDPELLRAKVASFVSLYRRGRELRRRAELIKERTQAAEKAETANRLKDRYLAIIGHDLRNPINAIAVAAERLRRNPSPEECRALTDRIGRAVRRADVIVGDVLDFTRGELGGGIAVAKTGADFGDIVRAVVHELAMLHPDRQITLNLGEPLPGRWDPQRVEQALGNLITNAIEHGSGEVTVSVARGEEGVIVRVHNRGSVIPAEALPTLFEPFRRTTGKNGGLGLGLYIVRQIAQAHGGRVEVSSVEEGTTFTSLWPWR